MRTGFSLFRRNHVGELAHEIRTASNERWADVTPRPDLDALSRNGKRRRMHVVEAGERFDRLVTVKPELRHRQQGTLWHCRCDCGGEALRYAKILNLRAREGHQQQCAGCVRAQRRRIAETWRDAVGEAYRRQFVDYGTLWMPSQTEKMLTDIRDALAAEFGDPDEWVPSLPFTAGTG